MQIRARDLRDLLGLGDSIKWHASNLRHNISLRRVTHTLKGVVLLVRHIVQLRFSLQDDLEFSKDLEYALFQSQLSAIEVRKTNGSSNIYIQGEFNVAQLRIYLLVNHPVDTIAVEVIEEKAA